ncbi:MAG: LamG domain-containing protein, partial [Candidatus Aenigmarchaeota archaeon]|nr:LamG domain-containing protein [Candidatus Aenigmarchaeota archaeon]
MIKILRKNKLYYHYTMIFIAIIILFAVLTLLNGITGNVVFVTALPVENGVYDYTYYDMSAGSIKLVDNYNAGTYHSQIYDAGETANWTSFIPISGMCYGCRLPDNKNSETGFINNLNMSQNILLMHMNDYGADNDKIIDSSGEVNDGIFHTGTSASASAEGMFGSALLFDGIDDYIETDMALGNQRTIAMWIYYTGTNGTLISIGSDFSLKIVDSKIFASDIDEYVSGNTFLQENNWYHVAYKYDSGSVVLYLNGEIDGSGVMASPLSGAGILIGKDISGNYFQGKIDELAVYNSYVSTQDIQNHYSRAFGNITFKVRSCDDFLCDMDEYVSFNNVLNISQNRYFQYKAEFSTSNPRYSPELKNVSIEYTITDQALVQPPQETVVFGEEELIGISNYADVFAGESDPNIVFVSPTPGNNSYIKTNHSLINTTVSENVSVCRLAWDGSVEFGDGSDGALSVTAENTVVNNYTIITADYNTSTTSITVQDASAFSSGDEVLIIQ